MASLRLFWTPTYRTHPVLAFKHCVIFFCSDPKISSECILLVLVFVVFRIFFDPTLPVPVVDFPGSIEIFRFPAFCAFKMTLFTEGEENDRSSLPLASPFGRINVKLICWFLLS